MIEEDYKRIEIVYGWNTKLSEKYGEGNLQSLRWVQKEIGALDAIPQSLRADPEVIISNVSGIHVVPVVENILPIS